MCKILHVSDFHVNLSYNKSSEKLEKLTQFFEKENIKVDFLVFTGDIIHAGAIAEKCKKSISKKHSILENDCRWENPSEMPCEVIEDYNNKLKEETKKAFSKATNIFEKFISGLNITDTKKIIMCCGNHDGLRLIKKETDPFTCGKITESDFEDKFAYYKDFCKTLNVEMGYGTQVYTISGINFLIANTNWKVPKDGRTNDACMNCKKIDNILNNNKEIFSYSNRMNNIFVAHKPFDDICENAKIDYSKDYEGNITVQNLRNTIGTVLYGDKHSYNMEETTEGVSFLAGAPLSGETISYNLIDFKVNKGVVFSQYIRWFKDTWGITPVKKNVEEIYKCSSQYIKTVSYKLLLDREEACVDADKTIKAVENAIKIGRVKTVSEMFVSCCRCREQMEKVNKGVRALQINEENIFEWVSKILTSGGEREHYSLNVRGECGVGKTTFLGMLYLYLLYLYKEGSFQYIPMYFNMEELIYSKKSIKEAKDYKKIHAQCYKGFEKFLNSCIDKEKKFKKPICVIVDGLDQTNFLTSGINTIEKDICKLLSEKIKSESKYVLCFNTYQSSRKMNTVDGVYSKHVLYFNTIDITENRGQSEAFYKIVKSYAALLGVENEYKKMLGNILEYRKNFLDLDFLHSNFEDICTLTVDESWEAMLVEKDRLAKQVEKWGMEVEKYRQAAFLLQQKNITFHELQDEIEEGITYEKYYLLKTKEDIRKYLFACYYVGELEKYSSNQSDNVEIDNDSVLFYFIPRDISIMIRLVLHEKLDVLDKFLEKHDYEIKDYLFSTMVYLVGHAKDSQVHQRFEAICAKEEVQKKQSLCGERSLKLAQIICSNSHDESVKYIYELMDDKEKRLFNRNYQLYYYGDQLDRTMLGKGKIENMDIVDNRFDFHNCFIVLSSKLTYNFKKKHSYKLMELDLFTLCDLLYSRLQHVKNSDENQTVSFFYCREYNKKGNSKVQRIVKTVVELLEKYIAGIKIYNVSLNSDERLYRFFKLMIKYFNKVLQEMKKYEDQTVDETYVSRMDYIERICEISNIKRIGWNIDEKETLKPERRERIVKTEGDTKETILQHVWESVQIAMFFLPVKLKFDRKIYKGKYSKQDIISILLIKEIGKYQTLDFPPYSADYSDLEKKEKEDGLELLLLGAVDGLISTQELYKLYDNSNKGEDINHVIAREIELIQMEYKYYILMSKGQINFSKDRAVDFEKEFDGIKTEVCRTIRDKLILSNYKFKRFFKY